METCGLILYWRHTGIKFVAHHNEMTSQWRSYFTQLHVDNWQPTSRLRRTRRWRRQTRTSMEWITGRPTLDCSPRLSRVFTRLAGRRISRQQQTSICRLAINKHEAPLLAILDTPRRDIFANIYIILVLAPTDLKFCCTNGSKISLIVTKTCPMGSAIAQSLHCVTTDSPGYHSDLI